MSGKSFGGRVVNTSSSSGVARVLRGKTLAIFRKSLLSIEKADVYQLR
jgi:hypothetical protein